jgi:hypothetical protein
MTMDGVAGPAVWHALLRAEAAGQDNSHGYTYARASENSPETLTIWHDGHVVLRTLANTGIPAAPTTIGTAPVYLRYRFQIMRGTNPDGTKYADPVSFVSYFRAGEAVHYFPRGSYGFPQSLGCVELPYGTAERAWPYAGRARRRPRIDSIGVPAAAAVAVVSYARGATSACRKASHHPRRTRARGGSRHDGRPGTGDEFRAERGRRGQCADSGQGQRRAEGPGAPARRR